MNEYEQLTRLLCETILLALREGDDPAIKAKAAAKAFCEGINSYATARDQPSRPAKK